MSLCHENFSADEVAVKLSVILIVSFSSSTCQNLGALIAPTLSNWVKRMNVGGVEEALPRLKVQNGRFRKTELVER